MRSRATAVLLAAFVVADLVSSGLCCLLAQKAAAPFDGCCTAESTAPSHEVLENPDATDKSNCGQGCYEDPGGVVARQGTVSTADCHAAIACGWVTDVVVDEHRSPCPRYSLPPPTSAGGHLVPTPRGPPVI